MSKYLVVGAGKSGVAAANFLVARGEEVSIADSSQHPEVPFPLDDRVRRVFGYQDETALHCATTSIVSPGVPLKIALLLNVTPDHMDRYPNFDAYAAAKYRIFRNQEKSDIAIVNASDRRAAQRGPAAMRTWRFSASQNVEEGAFLDGEALVLRVGGDERRIPRASLKLAGMANVENALAAWLAARPAG